jgi:hypothetical protein
MAVTNYQQWLADGRPWHNALVIDAFAGLMRGHGFTVYTLGDLSHLTASPPEDHCPYSQTPWPGAQPYPDVMALDIMPGGAVDWQALGVQIVADKRVNWPGTQWIKYVNWTDVSGTCRHASWQPDYAVRSSADTGHIHISARTDRIADALQGWDPVARLLNPTPSTQEDRMYEQSLPTGAQAQTVLLFPYSDQDNPAMSLGCDTQAGSAPPATKAAFRIAAHVAAQGWQLLYSQDKPLIIDAQDSTRRDIILPKHTDRVSIERIPLPPVAIGGPADMCAVPAAALAWW